MAALSENLRPRMAPRCQRPNPLASLFRTFLPRSRPRAPIYLQAMRASACRRTPCSDSLAQGILRAGANFKLNVPLTIHRASATTSSQSSDVQRRSRGPRGGNGFPRLWRLRGRRWIAWSRSYRSARPLWGPQVFEKSLSCQQSEATVSQANSQRAQHLRRRFAGRRALGLDQRRTAQDNPAIPAVLQKLLPHGWRDALPPNRQRRLSPTICCGN